MCMLREGRVVQGSDHSFLNGQIFSTSSLNSVCGGGETLYLPIASSKLPVTVDSWVTLTGKVLALLYSAKLCLPIPTSCTFILASEATHQSDGPV